MTEEKEIVAESTQQDSQAPQPSQQPEIAEAAPSKPVESKNFRELRLQAEKIARERDEARAEIEELRRKTQSSQPAQQPEDDEVRLGDDELAEGKHLAKFGRKIKNLESKLDTYEKQTSAIALEARLKAEHADFDKVVTQENIKSLALTYPDLARAIGASNDIYTQGKAAYTLIKQFGLDNDPNAEVEQKVIQKNLAKPKPAAAMGAQSGGMSPMERASEYYTGDLTDEMKRKFYQELQQAKMRQ